MPEGIDEALDLIAERAPGLLVQVAQVRRAARNGSAILHRRFDRLIQEALDAAEFTAEERRAFAEAVEAVPATRQRRNYDRVIISLPDGYAERLDREAKALGIGRSEFVRRLIDSKIPL